MGDQTARVKAVFNVDITLLDTLKEDLKQWQWTGTFAKVVIAIAEINVHAANDDDYKDYKTTTSVSIYSIAKNEWTTGTPTQSVRQAPYNQPRGACLTFVVGGGDALIIVGGSSRAGFSDDISAFNLTTRQHLSFVDGLLAQHPNTFIFSSCSDQAEYIYFLTNTSLFFKLSIFTKRLEELPKPPFKTTSQIGLYLCNTSSGSKIFYFGDDNYYCFDLTTNQWQKTAKPDIQGIRYAGITGV
eukprot:gene7367-8581_t